MKNAIFVLRIPDGRPGVYTFVNRPVEYPEGGLTLEFVQQKVKSIKESFHTPYELHDIIRLD